MAVREKRQGVYGITCIPTQDVYVGSSIDIDGRFRWHRAMLKRAKHHCSRLQAAWSAHGPDAFSFQVFSIPDKHHLVRDEQAFIDSCIAAGNCLNSYKTAINPLERKKPRQIDWSAQSWSDLTDTEIGKLTGYSSGQVALYRPPEIISPALTIDGLSAKARKGWETAKSRGSGWSSQTRQQRRESGLANKGNLIGKTPEERSERARRANAAMTPEQRSQRARKMLSSLSPARQLQRIAKQKATMTPERLIERGRKISETKMRNSANRALSRVLK